ncbi:heavy metal-associated isoprenylated plant protein 3 [Raphanus sativus]|nr:heavy metal-associated isoprenylated plant protein 3 [Raphanus sativus]
MGKNKQQGEGDNKSKNQKNGDSNKSDTKNQKNGESDKSDKKNQCKEIILKVYMHCEGCASQVSHCLRGYDGVEQIKTEVGDNKVVVSGKFDDPLKILHRVQKKFSKNAELISPKPNPNQDQKKEQQQKKESAPQIKTATLKMNIHCEGCVNEIKRGIEKIKGIQTAEPDRSKSMVVVRGVMDPPKLVEEIKKKLKRHAELAFVFKNHQLGKINLLLLRYVFEATVHTLWKEHNCTNHGVWRDTKLSSNSDKDSGLDHKKLYLLHPEHETSLIVSYDSYGAMIAWFATR